LNEIAFADDRGVMQFLRRIQPMPDLMPGRTKRRSDRTTWTSALNGAGLESENG
jgi:hypothetical protein